MMNAKIEEKNLASNKDAAIEKANLLSKSEKKNMKKEQSAAQQEGQKIEAKQEIRDIIISEELRIANSDLLFSKAKKQMKANAFQMKENADYFFAIDAEKKQISFRLKQAEDQISEKSFLCFYRARLASFYLKKEAKAKIESELKIKINEAKYQIQFSKDESKNFIQILA